MAFLRNTPPDPPPPYNAPPKPLSPTDIDGEAGGGVEVTRLACQAAVLLVHVIPDVGEELADLTGGRAFGVPLITFRGGRGHV